LLIEWIDGLNAWVKKPTADQMVELLNDLQIPAAQLPSTLRDALPDREPAGTPGWGHFAVDRRGISRAAWHSVRRAAEHVEARRVSSRTLLHGDLIPTNLLWREGTLVALDPRPCLGDPAFDAAQWWAFSKEPIETLGVLADGLGLSERALRDHAKVGAFACLGHENPRYETRPWRELVEPGF
jgi:aminoglycoside phosphotransferase (APT) family kinase protein